MIHTLLKALVCGILYFIGTILGGLVASAAGLPTPAMPKGTDANTLAVYLLLASLGIGGLLAYLAPRLNGPFLYRWLILALFGWVVYSLATYIEAVIYTTFDSASIYKVVMDLVAFSASSAAAAGFFKPLAGSRSLGDSARGWFSSQPAAGWAWRLAAIWAAFPVIYTSFGKLVEPFVIDVYRQGQLELSAPGWEQIIPAQLLRSLLFLLVSLGIIIPWNRSRLALLASLTAAFFLFVGGFYMLQAYWFPAGFRMIHSLEMLADAFTYAACLVALLYVRSGVVSEPVLSAP